MKLFNCKPFEISQLVHKLWPCKSEDGKWVDFA